MLFLVTATWQLRRCEKLSQLSNNTFWEEKKAHNVFRHRSRSLVKQPVKLGKALLIGPAENCPISHPVRLLLRNCFRLRVKVSQ